MNDLIPRAPKRKRQPTAECMREQLRLAADEIIRLRERHVVAKAAAATYSLSDWWRGIFRRAP